MNGKGNQEQGGKSPRSKSPLMGVAGLLKELGKNPPTPQSEPPTEGERRTSSGILRLDPTKPRRRSSVTSVELRNDDPASPCPSDRLSVTWADGEKSVSSDASVTLRGKTEIPSENPSMITLQPASAPMSPSSMTSPTSPSGTPKNFLRDPELDNELEASVSVILQRSSSMRMSKKKSRRKSTLTSTSSGDTQVNLDSETSEEKVKLYNEVLAGVKHQPWPMKKKLYLARIAKDFLAKHEGELEERLAQSSSTKDVLYHYFIRFRRVVQMAVSAVYNWMMSVELWKGRVKRIESHFGSAVASYFTFLRWVMGLNAVIAILLAAFVIIPETLAGEWRESGERKQLLREERFTAFDLKTLWDFEGILRYSPIFYGFYSKKKSTKEGYRLPLAYILTAMCVYGYSFIAILRKMAANSRMSKLGDDDETVFTFRLFAAWDYTIGNTEAAQNKVASINMGFRESLLEAREVDREEKSWKVTVKRGVAHFLVLCLLVGSAYAVILLVDRSKEVNSKSSWWRQNELTVILNLISIAFPKLFDLIGLLENCHPRKQLQWKLARIMALNLLNLYTLIFALFGKVDDMSKELISMKGELHGLYNIPFVDASNEVDLASTSIPTFSLKESIFPTVTVAASFIYGLNVSSTTPSSLNMTDFDSDITSEPPRCRQLRIPCPSLLLPVESSNRSFNGDFSSSQSVSGVPFVNESSLLRDYAMEAGGSSYQSEAPTDVTTGFPFLLERMISPTENSAHSERTTTEEEGITTTSTTTTTTTTTTATTTSFVAPDFSGFSGAFPSPLKPFLNVFPFHSLPLNDTPNFFERSRRSSDPDSGLRQPRSLKRSDFVALNLRRNKPLLREKREESLGEISHRNGGFDQSFAPENSPEIPTYLLWYVDNATLSSDENGNATSMDENGNATYLDENGNVTFSVYENDNATSVDENRNTSPVDENNNTSSSTVIDIAVFENLPSNSIGNVSDYESIDTTLNDTYNDEASKFSAHLNSTLNKFPHPPLSPIETGNSSNPIFSALTTDFASKETTPKEENASIFFFITYPVDPFETEKAIGTEGGTGTTSTSEVSTRKPPTDSTKTTASQVLTLTTPRATTSTTITYNTEEYPQYFDNSFGTNQECFIVVDECDDETSPQPFVEISDSDNFTFNFSLPNGTKWNASLPPSEASPTQFAIQSLVPTTVGPEALVRYLPAENRTHLRKLCWETMFGQEIVKLTVMDLVLTVVNIVVSDYIRAVIVRVFSKRCCWDLEKQFPGYPDFEIAENILHLVNNQGLVWMGMFFSPGLPALNLAKLFLLLYVRSWAVVTSNVPPETVFKASDNNNFYLTLLLIMLFLCTLPVGYAVVWLTPSWHCGPFSNNKKIYQLATEALITFLPDSFEPIIDYISSPGVVIPAGLLLILVIYYLMSLTAALREAVQDLKDQLRRERDAEKQKAMEARSAKKVDTPMSRWARLIQLTPIIPHKFDMKKSEPEEDDKNPLLAGQKQKRSSNSPAPDDTTDPGHSEVFDDSLSEPRKAIREARPKMDRMKDASTQKQRQANIAKDDKRRRGSRESSGGGSLPRSPRMKNKHYHQHPKEESPSKMTQTYRESPRTRDEHRRRSSKEQQHRDSPKRSKAGHRRQLEEHPEGGDERDVRSKASQEILRITEEYPELRDSYEFKDKEKSRKAHRKCPASPEKTDRDDSPTKHQSGHKHKREKPILTMSEVHNGQAKVKKRDSSKRQKREKEKEDKQPDTPEMQTIPVIKISKEDSVERSIQQAKLERQSQTTEDNEPVTTEGHQLPPDRPAPPPTTSEEMPPKVLETDIDEPIYQAMSEVGKVDEEHPKDGEEEPSTETSFKEDEQQSESIAAPELDKDIVFADAPTESATPSETPPRQELNIASTIPDEDHIAGSVEVAAATNSPRYRSRKPPPLKIPSAEDNAEGSDPPN